MLLVKFFALGYIEAPFRNKHVKFEVSGANLVMVLSGTTFWQCSEHCSIWSPNLACTWLKWWFMIGCWHLFIFSLP